MRNYLNRILIVFLGFLLTLGMGGYEIVHGQSLLSEEDLQTSLGNDKVEELLKLLPEGINSKDPMLKLVNKSNPLQEELIFDWAYSDSGLPYNAGIQPAYEAWMEAANQAGYSYQFVSGYRSMEEQKVNRMARYQSYLSEGVDPDYAQNLVDKFYAPIDASEHLTGLALDLLGTDWTSQGGELTAAYADMASAQWLANSGPDYGFILRYPSDKEAITGYHFEPWHFRYVGEDHAHFMTEHHLTLEEYLSLIQMKENKTNS